ncbi:iron ABC transporter permease [Glaciecola sp. XM2]|uniref:ABC transporter permease n=1 Tax=Glaciecola sp. XM2 TaxID=1914931 RepID=UPI001BDEFB23|nr:iron ABC transporter permease [Glaciecola sp. XM2]MBT1450020.1 iron ABC transporter permease [Glaciecola sp. XM2]
MPLIIVAASVFSIDTQLWTHLLDTVFTEYVFNSLVLAGGVGLGAIVIGTYLAYIMVNYRFWGKGVLSWLLMLPLAMPAYIIAYTYTGLLDFSGPIQTALRETFGWSRNDYWFWDIRSLSGAIVMMILVLYPYVYILARSAFAEQSYSFNKVSELAGYTRLQHIKHVSLPLARPAILTGASLAMMEALADYGTVAYFGISTFSTGIFRTWFGMGSLQGAAQLSTVLCVFVLVLLVLEKHSRKDAARYQSRQAKSISPVKLPGVIGLGVFALCLIPAIFGFIIPFIQLAIWSIEYATVGDLGDFITLIQNSLSLAALGAGIIVLFAVVVSYSKRLNEQQPSKMPMKTVEQALSLGYALPGIVIAVGVLILAGWTDRQINQFTQAWFDYRPGLIISGGMMILIFAYAVRFISVALQNTETGFMRVPQKLDQAALSLSPSYKRLLGKIQIPLLSASLISATLLVFVDILKELPATLVLRPFNFNTLAVRAYELASDERLIDAALPAITIVLVGLIPVVLLTRQLNKANV